MGGSSGLVGMLSRPITALTILLIGLLSYWLIDWLSIPPPPEPPPQESRLNIPRPPPVEVSRGEVDRNGVNMEEQVKSGDHFSGMVEMVVKSTSYSHTGSKTYTGTWPQEGRTIAVDPTTIPIGSMVYINELDRWFIAEDKIPPKSVAKGAIVDIFRNCESCCWEWGRRDINVKVVPPRK